MFIKEIIQKQKIIWNKNIILEKIKKYINSPSEFVHIVSLNPENAVIAFENEEFKNCLKSAQFQIVDGMGLFIMAKVLGYNVQERITGVELMEALVKLIGDMRLRAVFIGGQKNLANDVAKCYRHKYPQGKFSGFMGFENIKNPSQEEEKKLFSIITDLKPRIIFAAFGSPYQELWFCRHREQLKGIVCLGVGGGFDYVARVVPRAPWFIRLIGLEWLFRLIIQPWRWRRQLRLLKFVWLVLKEMLDQN